MNRSQMDVRTLAIAAIMIAIVTVATLVIRVPIPATGGYFNFSDVAIYFAAFSFGPWIGLAAGGVGTAIADAIGFPAFILISLVAHGGQGFVAGLVGVKRDLPQMAVGWVLGSLVMIGVYFIAEALWFGGLPAALAEVGPNILQNIGGGILGIALVLAVRRAYPPILRFGPDRS